MSATPACPARLFNASGTKAAEIAPHMAAFLLLWWVAAWFTLTFISPFAEISNGFFACWVAPGAALLLCRALNPAVAEPLGQAVAAARGAGADRSALFLLCVTSTGVWIAAAVVTAAGPEPRPC